MGYKKSAISKKSIIKELKRIAKKLDKFPTWTDCLKSTQISMTRLKKHFITFNDALEAANLPVNRKRKLGLKPAKNIYSTKRKSTFHIPIFTDRFCNVCEKFFIAEDYMRSCPACTAVKRNAELSGGLSDTAHGIGYLH